MDNPSSLILPLLFDLADHTPVITSICSRKIEFQTIIYWLDEFSGASLAGDQLIAKKIKQFIAVSVRSLLGRRPALELPSDVTAVRQAGGHVARLIHISEYVNLWTELADHIPLREFVLEASDEIIGGLVFNHLTVVRVRQLIRDDTTVPGDRFERGLRIGESLELYIAQFLAGPVFSAKNILRDRVFKLEALVDSGCVDRELLRRGMFHPDFMVTREVLLWVREIDGLEGLVDIAGILLEYFQVPSGSFSFFSLKEIPDLSRERQRTWLSCVISRRVLEQHVTDVEWQGELWRNIAHVSAALAVSWEIIVLEKLSEIFFASTRRIKPLELLIIECMRFIESDVVERIVKEMIARGDIRGWELFKPFFSPQDLLQIEIFHSVQKLIFSDLTKVKSSGFGAILTSGQSTRKAELYAVSKNNCHYEILSSFQKISLMDPIEILHHVFFFNQFAFLDTQLLQEFLALFNITQNSPSYASVLHLAGISYLLSGEIDGAASIAQRLVRDYRYPSSWRLVMHLPNKGELLPEAVRICDNQDLTMLVEELRLVEKVESDRGYPNSDFYIHRFPDLSDRDAVDVYLAAVGGSEEAMPYEAAELLARSDFSNLTNPFMNAFRTFAIKIN
jgi:hypothetical protein